MKRYIYLRKPLAILLACLMLMTAFAAAPALAAEGEVSRETLAAEALHSLGLFLGYGDDEYGEPMFGLGDSSTRLQGVIMLLRLLDLYYDARESSFHNPFEDVTGDYNTAIVAFAHEMRYTSGISPTRFDPTGRLSAAMFLTYVLRVLGYRDGLDFNWNSSWELTDTLGITNGRFNALNNTLQRGDMVLVSLFALEQTFKDSEQTLVEALIDREAVPSDAVRIVNSAIRSITGLQPPPESGSGNFVYIAARDAFRTQSVGGESWFYYSAWEDGVAVQGGLPLMSEPWSAHRFYTLSARPDGRYTVSDAFSSGIGSASSPWVGEGNVRALTSVPLMGIGGGSASANQIDFGSSLRINIGSAVFADTRHVQEQIDNPITLSSRGIIDAIVGPDFAHVRLSVVYDNITRQASVVYIAAAAPASVPASTALAYFPEIALTRVEFVGMSRWNYYQAWRDGSPVRDGIPLVEAPEHGHRFYTTVLRTDGLFIARDPWVAGTGTAVNPWRNSSGQTRALTQVILNSAHIAASSLNIIDFGNELMLNFTSALIGDTRDVDEQREVQVLLTPYGLMSALDAYATVTVSLVYEEATRRVVVAYITEVVE